MRNWHHRIIKLDEALALITNNNRTVIAVSEGSIEFEVVNPLIGGLTYRAKNKGLFEQIGNVQKASLIGQVNGVASPDVLSIINGKVISSAHTTSVAGVILGNESDSNNINLPVRGIIEDAELMNLSPNLLSLLCCSIDDFNYYNNTANTILNSNFVSPFNANVTYNNNVYTPPNKQSIIVNASYILTLANVNAIALYDVFFKTIKAYSNKGRGILFVVAAGNSGASSVRTVRETLTLQHYGKFDDPLIVSAVTIDDKKVFEEISEFKSTYSSYGDRVDVCAPSNGGTAGKREIYTTCNVKCGEIGYDDEVVLKNITTQSQNGNLTLANTHQIFPGNCVEIGLPGSINHEVLIVKDVDRQLNEITFLENRFYTATPFNINPAQVKIPILRSSAVIEGTTRSQFSVTDKRALGYVGQEICIFNGIINHYAKITLVNSATRFEFNPALPANYATVNLEVIPGQIVIIPASYMYNVNKEGTEFTFATINDQILRSFFDGGMVAVFDSSNSPDVFLEVANIQSIDLISRKIVLDKYNLQSGLTSTKLVSVGYGSYTSSFGGTSAAAPVVSGVAGLIHKANPDLNFLEIKHILKSTTDKIVLKENSSIGEWKDKANNNISFFSVSSSLTQNTVLGSNEIFVSNIGTFSINDTIEIDGDFKSVIERVLPDRLILQLSLNFW